MRVSVMIRLGPGADPADRPAQRITDYARRIEAGGFPGIWVGDSLGRGRPTLDPLIALATLCAATERVELGIAVLQVPLRHPVELAHRVQSVQALSGGRLRLGVGSGSTRADFELLGADYDRRFRTFMNSLDTMRVAWGGQTVNGGALSLWPGCRGGPPILLGAMRIYRDAGGHNAVLANVAIDLAERPESASLAEVAHVSLICPPEEARRRLKRIEELGFDEVLLVSHAGVLDEIERARDFA